MKKQSNKFSVWWKRFRRKVSKFFTPKRKRNLRIILLNLVGMVAVAFLVPYFALVWIDDYTKHGEVCEVPGVCGMPLEEAESILAENKLGYVVIEKKYKEGGVKDEVLEQYPRGPIKNADGSLNVKYVKEGREIALVINNGEKPKQDIPNIIQDCSYREAVHRLKGNGFNVVKVDTVDGERDWVYALKYNGRELQNGATIPRGSDLTIVIGGGEDMASDTTVIDESYFE